MPVGYRSYRHAFSLKRKTAIGTPVADGDITYQRGDIDFSPVGTEEIVSVGDANFFGKAPFGTFRERLHIANILGSRERPASDLDCLYALAFVMGGLSSAQPDALLLPNTWEHTLTFVDHATKPEMDYTSVLELLGSGSNPGYKEKFNGVWLDKASLSLEFGDFVKLAYEGGARSRATSTATMPTGVSPASLFKAAVCQVTFGDSGSEVNIDGEWISFELEFNSNPTRVIRSGQSSGEEQFIHRVDRGMQSVTGSITVELDNTDYRQKFITDTEVGVTLVLRSDDLVDSNRKTLTIELPHVKIANGELGVDDEVVSYKMTIDETSVLRATGVQPVTVTLSSDIDNTEIFVTS